MDNDNNYKIGGLSPEALYSRLSDLTTTQAQHSERLKYMEQSMETTRRSFETTINKLSEELATFSETIRSSTQERYTEQVALNNRLVAALTANQDSIVRTSEEFTRREKQIQDTLSRFASTTDKLNNRIDELEDYIKAQRTTLNTLKILLGVLGTGGIGALAKFFIGG